MNRRVFLAGASTGLLYKLLGVGQASAEEIAPDVQKAIDRGLEWLSKQQKGGGYWEGTGGQYATAMTGMAGMALLMEGSTLREGKYSSEIRKGVAWVLENTRQSGLIAGDNGRLTGERYNMHGHGFALLFLASAYGEEQDERQRKQMEETLTRCVDFTVKAQTKSGGWFYVSAADGNNQDEGSTTVTQLQALRAARNAGIPVPPDSITRAQKYLEVCTGPNGGIYYSPVVRQEKPALAAAGVVCGFSIGDYRTASVKKWIKFTQSRVGGLGGGRMGHDEYAHYYWAQAIYNLGEKGYDELFPGAPESERLTWSKYRKETFDGLVKSQSNDHWTGAGTWSHIGPVYVTSIYLTILQLDKGTLPIYQR